MSTTKRGPVYRSYMRDGCILILGSVLCTELAVIGIRRNDPVGYGYIPVAIFALCIGIANFQWAKQWRNRG